MDPIANTIAITSGLLGAVVGAVLLIPSVMAFDAAPNTKRSMEVIGYSGLSAIPLATIATVMSIVTGDLTFQSIHLIPYSGIALGFVIESFSPKEPISNSP